MYPQSEAEDDDTSEDTAAAATAAALPRAKYIQYQYME